MTTQLDLFSVHPTLEAHQGGKAEAARLTGQRAKVLARLQAGRASNVELSAICLRYSARIFEIRKAGYVIDIVSADRDSGITIYELRP